MKHRQARAAAAALTLSLAAAGAEIDAGTGLVMQPGWQDVRAHCGTCHSLGLVTHQRADRATWLAMIRWMQETQNLWALPPEVEDRILGYLAEHYPPGEYARRAPIAPELMPR